MFITFLLGTSKVKTAKKKKKKENWENAVINLTKSTPKCLFN